MVRAPAKLLSSQKVESVILTIHTKHWIKKKCDMYYSRLCTG